MIASAARTSQTGRATGAGRGEGQRQQRHQGKRNQQPHAGRGKQGHAGDLPSPGSIDTCKLRLHPEIAAVSAHAGRSSARRPESGAASASATIHLLCNSYYVTTDIPFHHDLILLPGRTLLHRRCECADVRSSPSEQELNPRVCLHHQRATALPERERRRHAARRRFGAGPVRRHCGGGSAADGRSRLRAAARRRRIARVGLLRAGDRSRELDPGGRVVPEARVLQRAGALRVGGRHPQRRGPDSRRLRRHRLQLPGRNLRQPGSRSPSSRSNSRT